MAALVVAFVRHNERPHVSNDRGHLSRRRLLRASSRSRPTWLLILVPAWTAYSRVWERMAAAVLSLYVAGGVRRPRASAGGAAIVWFWDRIGV